MNSGHLIVLEAREELLILENCTIQSTSREHGFDEHFVQTTEPSRTYPRPSQSRLAALTDLAELRWSGPPSP